MINLVPDAIDLRKGKDIQPVILLYATFVLVITGYYLLNLPISVGDTDLWYHMNSGRYTLTQKEIPKTSFFPLLNQLEPGSIIIGDSKLRYIQFMRILDI